MSPKYGTKAWRTRRRPIELHNLTNPYQTRHPLEDLAGPSIRSATVKAFDATTWTATIQVTGSLASYLENVPVAKTLNAQLLTAGARVGAIFFDDSNPTDAAVVTVYGAVPAAYVTSDMIVDLTIATGNIADLAITTAKIAALAVTTAKIADLNVTTGKIDDLAVTTGKLAAQAVTGAKCLANQANGVATIDSASDMSPPGDIYAVGDFYPTNQALSKFYWDGTYLAANNNFKVYGALLTTGAIYPSGQGDRSISDDGTYTKVSAGLWVSDRLVVGTNITSVRTQATVAASGGTLDIPVSTASGGLLIFHYYRTNNSTRTGASLVLVSAGAAGDTRVSVIAQVNDAVITDPSFAASGDNLRFTNNDANEFKVRYHYLEA